MGYFGRILFSRLFAKAVMDHWKVGKAACNNGIVLALAVTDRLMHIATGKGAKEHLPDAELEVVIERMKPLLRDGQYADAAEQAVSDVARILSGESFRPSGLAAVAQYVPVFLFGGIFLFVMGDNCRKQRRYRRCKRALTQIEQERAKATAERLQVESCSICLETFAENKAPTRLLPCGHTFHSACVDGWEESKGTCPICRCSTDTGDAARPGVTTRARAGSSGGFYDDEYRFRIRRAHSIWPEYVSDSMAQRWCAPHFSGPLVADVSFIRSSPSYSSNRGSGSGSSTSFGGGHSGGGGGAGGSW
ncbi:unnamed protein product [Effrenium voratum]|uniref:RING-type domain-containing protein n=1 Tax=Effrenium voratum TaxID=2562239 RepID=A0AA36NI02_9DINO|nr:unnamed protein product [Effrenium voratum]